jgi:hypothetical protein
VSKTPKHFTDQFQELDELYQELLELRLEVRRAERVAAQRGNVDPKDKRNPTRRKPKGRKPAR